MRDWSDRGLSDATMMNCMAHVRWWADQVGKGNMVGTNAEYGIDRHSHVSDGARRCDLDAEKLALVKDALVRMALRLQAAFGLRREEAIKFSPRYADRGDRVAVKASTAKGGGSREVPVLKDSQRRLLEEARRLAGGGAPIPPRHNYAEQRKVYGDQTGRRAWTNPNGSTGEHRVPESVGSGRTDGVAVVRTAARPNRRGAQPGIQQGFRPSQGQWRPNATTKERLDVADK